MAVRSAWMLVHAVWGGLTLAAVTVAGGQAAVVQSGDLRLQVYDNNGAIASLEFAGTEFYRRAQFVSNFGFELDGRARSFAVASTRSPTDLPAAVVKQGRRVLTAQGSYGVGGASIAWSREYRITRPSGSLRVSTTVTNTDTRAVRLRLFDSFDPDQDTPVTFATSNDVITLAGGPAGQAVGSSGAVVIGGKAPGFIVASGGPFSITADTIDAFFSNPVDGDGVSADLGLHIGRSVRLRPGQSRTVTYFQGYGATAADAQAAFVAATPLPGALPLLAAGMGALALLRGRRRSAEPA